MQFTPAGASAAHQKLGAGPSGPSVKAASASGAPQRARAAQSAKLMASGHRVRVCSSSRATCYPTHLAKQTISKQSLRLNGITPTRRRPVRSRART